MTVRDASIEPNMALCCGLGVGRSTRSTSGDANLDIQIKKIRGKK
jgi:hypothetical protein